MELFNNILNDYMEATETSAEDLAAKIGVTRQLIYRWKDGTVTRPSCEAVRIAAYFLESNANSIVAYHATKSIQYFLANFTKNVHIWLATTPNDSPHQLVAWQKSLELTEAETRGSFFKGKRIKENQAELTTQIEKLSTATDETAVRAKILHLQAALLRLINQAAKGLQQEEREAIENKAWELKVFALQLDPVSPTKLLMAAGCAPLVPEPPRPVKSEEKSPPTSFSLFLPGEPWPYPGSKQNEPVIKSPINIPWQFFGKDQEVTKILESWSSTKQSMESWFITGGRGTGKTSLLLLLYKLPLYSRGNCLRPDQDQQFKKYDELLKQLMTVYVDFSDPTLKVTMLYQIAEQLGFSNPENLNHFPEKPSEKFLTFKEQMDVYLRQAIDDGKKTVILINDLHKLAGYEDLIIESFEEIWAMFNHYTSIYNQYLTFCVSSRLLAKELFHKIEDYQYSSSFITRFEQLLILKPYYEDKKTH